VVRQGAAGARLVAAALVVDNQPEAEHSVADDKSV